jgi:hypothetical protein
MFLGPSIGVIVSKFKGIPFEYLGADCVSPDMAQFYNVQFLENWGPFTSGQYVDILVLDTDRCEVYTTNDEGKRLVEVNIKFVPE